MPNPSRKRSALVVDDSATMRLQMRMFLERAGFEVVEASNGMHALLLLETMENVDVVLTDLNMPEIDGITLIRCIRAHSKYGLLPIIIQSSEAHGSIVAAGKAAGATAWLVKPYSEERLLLTVRRLFPHAAT